MKILLVFGTVPSNNYSQLWSWFLKQCPPKTVHWNSANLRAEANDFFFFHTNKLLWCQAWRLCSTMFISSIDSLLFASSIFIRIFLRDWMWGNVRRYSDLLKREGHIQLVVFSKGVSKFGSNILSAVLVFWTWLDMYICH